MHPSRRNNILLHTLSSRLVDLKKAESVALNEGDDLQVLRASQAVLLAEQELSRLVEELLTSDGDAEVAAVLEELEVSGDEPAYFTLLEISQSQSTVVWAEDGMHTLLLVPVVLDVMQAHLPLPKAIHQALVAAFSDYSGGLPVEDISLCPHLWEPAGLTDIGFSQARRMALGETPQTALPESGPYEDLQDPELGMRFLAFHVRHVLKGAPADNGRALAAQDIPVQAKAAEQADDARQITFLANVQGALSGLGNLPVLAELPGSLWEAMREGMQLYTEIASQLSLEHQMRTHAVFAQEARMFVTLHSVEPGDPNGSVQEVRISINDAEGLLVAGYVIAHNRYLSNEFVMALASFLADELSGGSLIVDYRPARLSPSEEEPLFYSARQGWVALNPIAQLRPPPGTTVH